MARATRDSYLTRKFSISMKDLRDLLSDQMLCFNMIEFYIELMPHKFCLDLVGRPNHDKYNENPSWL